METKQGRSRHQWRIDLEVRVFGGGPDQHDQPLFDGGQQRVLLGLVEPVHLVEEQDRSGAALAESVTSRRNLFPHVLHRRRDRRQLDEHLLGRRRDQTRQARLPGSGGPQKITDDNRSPSIRARNGRPGASRWRWPTTSSRLRGRSRAASGERPDKRSSAAAANRSSAIAGTLSSATSRPRVHRNPEVRSQAAGPESRVPQGARRRSATGRWSADRRPTVSSGTR